MIQLSDEFRTKIEKSAEILLWSKIEKIDNILSEISDTVVNEHWNEQNFPSPEDGDWEDFLNQCHGIVVDILVKRFVG